MAAIRWHGAERVKYWIVSKILTKSAFDCGFFGSNRLEYHRSTTHRFEGARERAQPSFDPDIALGGVGFCSIHAQSEIGQKRRLGPTYGGKWHMILMLTTQPFDPLTSRGTA